MALNIITADQRLANRSGIKGVILGKAGIGKTSLLWTLPADKTMLVDAEAGDLAIDGWSGPSLDVRKESMAQGMHPWLFLKALACWFGGPNPAARPDQDYSEAHYAWCVEKFGDPASLSHIETIFVDSITVASRLAFGWSQTQPRAFSEKTGKPDNRGAYGLLGQEMVGWLTQLQHTRGKNVWLVGVLEEVTDDFGRKTWQPQIEGGATARALPGIVDQVITMAEVDFGEVKARAFVTQTINPHGVPAKDRSGQLDPVEEPHLGRLMEKIAAKGRARALNHGLPAPVEPAAPVTEQPAVDKSIPF